MILEFTDDEYAVITNSLSDARDRLRGGGTPTPTIDSAVRKLGLWASPAGCEFLVATGEDADALRPHLVRHE